MDAVRRNMDGFGVGLMLLLCVLWGFQQVAIKVAAHDMIPIIQVGLRCGISALLVALVMLVRREGFSFTDGTAKPGICAGVLFGAEFLLLAKGLEFTSASHMVIFLYTSPIFTALGLQLMLPSERLTPRQWLGIGIAFCGIATAFAGGFLQTGVNSSTLKGDFLGILSGAGWGATTVVIRSTKLSGAAPTKTLVYQLVVACLILLGYAGVTGKMGTVTMTGVVWASLMFQAIVISFATYLAWFWLLTRYLASRLATFSFMTPLFGVGFGVALLHEPVDAYFGVGALLVLAGIVMVSVRRPVRSDLSVPAVAVSNEP